MPRKVKFFYESYFWCFSQWEGVYLGKICDIKEVKKILKGVKITEAGVKGLNDGEQRRRGNRSYPPRSARSTARRSRFLHSVNQGEGAGGKGKWGYRIGYRDRKGGWETEEARRRTVGRLVRRER